MSPMMEDMLMHEVVPRLRAAAPLIPKTGCEDNEEIAHDAILMAARMMDSAERAGRSFTGGNIAWYASRAARGGRRSYYAGRSDALSAGCLLDGRAVHDSLDEGIDFGCGETGSRHDVIGSPEFHGREADPADEAGRNLDWEAFLASHPPRHRIAVTVLLEGGTMREAGRRCGLGDSAALLLKRKVAADLIGFFGEDVVRRLLDGARPGWESDLRTARGRHSGGAGEVERSPTSSDH